MKTLISSLIAVIVIMFAVNANAAGLKWSDDYSMHDCILVSEVNSAGVCIGTLAEVKTASGNKLIGIGGATIAANEKGSLEVGGTVFTVFNDMLWVGFKDDTKDTSFNSLGKDIKVSVGIVVSDAVRKLMK